MENLFEISHIKNVSKKSPTAKKNLNHISKTSTSSIDLTFANETIKQLIAKNKLMTISKLMWNPKTEILINLLMKNKLYLMTN